MKGNTIISKIYDIMLYIYCYVEVVATQLYDEAVEFRDNHKWIKKNGPYRGKNG